MQALPLGFTPTSVGMTGQQIKQSIFRKQRGKVNNNRKRTPGRPVQYVEVYERDSQGNLPVDRRGIEQKIPIGMTRIITTPFRRLINR